MVSLRYILVASGLAAVASAANHTIVAQSDLTFNPDTISAAEGDWLIFQFQAQNHSVASGPFGTPCEPPKEGGGGFFSGYFPTTSGTNQQQFSVQVHNASTPIWFYCTQAVHCTKGMVGAVNPTKDKTLALYKAGAATFAKDGVAPASVGGGTIEKTNGAASLRVSAAVAVLGLIGATALLV